MEKGKIHMVVNTTQRGMSEFSVLLIIILALVFTLIIYFIVRGGLERVLK